MVKIGVIGTGRIGSMHVRNLARLEEVEEVLLHDRDDGAAGSAARHLDGRAEVCSTLEEVLGRADAVVIATPTGEHPDLLRTCVAHGLPVLCEKPVALETEVVRDLARLVEDGGPPVVVGFQRRFDPDLVALRERLRTGSVGRLLVLRSTAYDAEPPSHDYLPLSGGIFRDLLIHDLDAVPWLVGEAVTSVSAQGSVLVDDAFAEVDDVDVAAVTLTFAGGAIAQLVGTRLDPLGYDHRLEVLGTGDSLVVGLADAERAPLAHLGVGGRRAGSAPWSGFAERFAAAYRAEVATFVRVAEGRAANPSPLRDSLVSLELAEACETSRREGRPVEVLTAAPSP